MRLIFIFLFLGLQTAYAGDYTLVKNGITQTGRLDASNSSGIKSLLTSIGRVAPASLSLRNTQWIIQDNVSFSQNIRLSLSNSSFKIKDGGLLKIYGPFFADYKKQIFFGGPVKLYSSKNLNSIQWFGAKANGIDSITEVLHRAVAALNPGTTLFFPTGSYILKTSFQKDNLKKITFKGQVGSKIIRSSLIPLGHATALWRIRFSEDLVFDNLEFVGTTTGRSIKWGEEGLLLGSTKNSKVMNSKFSHFGDACLRITTSSSDSRQIGSFDATVIFNKFHNCTQITTTNTDDRHGGTYGYYMANNIFSDLKGGVKFASRTPGAGKVRITRNHIQNSFGKGFEIVSYSNVKIYDNTIENIQTVAIALYTNSEADVGFSVNNFLFTRNKIKNAGDAAFIRNKKYNDGSVFTYHNVSLAYNSWENIKGLDNMRQPYRALIRIYENDGATFNNVDVSGNTFLNPGIPDLIFVDPNVTNLTCDKNCI